MEKQFKFLFLAIISLGLVLAAPAVYRQGAKAQGAGRMDIFYTNNVEGYLEPCG